MNWKNLVFPAAIIFLLLLLYTFMRYVVFGNVSIDNAPLYLFNKAFAIASVFLIGISFLLGPLAHFWPKIFTKRLELRGGFGLLGFAAAAIHSIISVIILTPAYYPKFFAESGKLTFSGELILLFGVLALFIFTIVAITSIPVVEKTLNKKQWHSIQRMGYIAFVLVMLHVFVMGYAGWLTPDKWLGGLLPISLISFSVIAFVLLMRIATMVVKK